MNTEVVRQFLFFGLRTEPRRPALNATRMIRRVCLVAFAAPLATVFVCLRFRFSSVSVVIVRSTSSKVSLLIEDLESWRRMAALHSHETRFRNILFVYQARHRNDVLGRLFRDQVRLIDKTRTTYGFLLRYALPVRGFRRFYGPCREALRSGAWSESRSPLTLPLSMNQMRADLERMLKLSPDEPIIGLAVAESAYYAREVELGNRAPYDKRLIVPDLARYLAATQRIRPGLPKFVRLAAFTTETVPKEFQNIVDYASRCRSPGGDVVLAAHSAFFVSAATGAFWLASCFDRPVLVCDQYSLHRSSPGSSDLYVPILARERSTGNFKPFRWYLRHRDWAQSPAVSMKEIELVFNSETDISEAIDEMWLRLQGLWRTSPEDARRQRRLRALIDADPRAVHAPGVMISSRFLEKFESLLS